jgi:hypothetical protein
MAWNDSGIRLMGQFGRGDDTFVSNMTFNTSGALTSISAVAGLTVGTAITDLLGFYGATAVAQPVVPTTSPSIQNVITALVALGLVAQHD